MPLIETTGSGSAKALGLNSASGPVNYIEDVFSTYLYTGNSSTNTITNGIDLSGKGGLVWCKSRTSAYDHALYDTARGINKELYSNTTSAQYTGANTLTAFNSNGFTLGASSSANSDSSVSWTFRKQAKFFDVVTYTGTGNNFNNIVSHSLGSLPGFVVYKCTSTTSNWGALARNSAGNYETLRLNTTESSFGAYDATNAGLTSTTFNPGKVWGNETNASGQTYVAYLFAHNAGGFGLTGTDNVISCGSYTTDVSGNATVNLGWEPQWFLRKRSDAAGDWRIADSMRGWTALGVSGDGSGQQQVLRPNLSNAEGTFSTVEGITSTGFGCYGMGAGNETYIYIAIRRGPMKTPTSGTSVFVPTSANPAVATLTVTNGIVNDLMIGKERSAATIGINYVFDRLRGLSNSLNTTATSQEVSYASPNGIYFDRNNGIKDDFFGSYLGVNSNVIYWCFQRAPSFMDVVCYTGTGAASQTYNHNLGVVPELMIVKSRSNAVNWAVYNSSLGATKYLQLNTDIAANTSSLWWYNTAPTSSVFTVANGSNTGGGGYTYVAYLFASCPGVSKVGSYSGTGATQTISCGFAARFVMIKRTDSTGDWWVWDTARGMVAGTDPRLALNLTTAETNANWVYTNASGFQIVTTDATVNASGGSYIYLAIA